MRILSIFLLLALSGSSAFADSRTNEFESQHRKFFHLLEPNRTQFEVSFLHQPGQEEDGGNAEIDLSNLEVRKKTRRALSRSSFFTWGLGYDTRFYDFVQTGGARINESDDALTEASISGGLGHFLSDDLLFEATAKTGVFSNFSGDVNEDDWQVHGKGLIVYRLSSTSQLLVGVASDNTFDGEDFYPIGGIRLMSDSGKLHVTVTAPIEAEVIYNLNPNLSFYGGVWVEGDEYNVKMDGEEFDVYAHDRRFGAGANFWFNDNVRVGLEGGLAFESDLDLKIRNPGMFEDGAEQAAYIKASLGFNLW